jgi:DNA-binding transcriptional LysR family regulator
LGIAMVPTVIAGAEVKAGAPVPLLRGYKLSPVDVHAVFPGGAHRPRFARWSIISPKSYVGNLPNEHFRFGVARPT